MPPRVYTPFPESPSKSDLEQACNSFYRWLSKTNGIEAAKTRLEGILQQVRSRIDTINSAHERACEADATQEDCQAYLEAISDDFNTDDVQHELDRMSEVHPEIESQIEEVRMYVSGLASLLGK